jgi:hypothetical protein
VIAVPFPEDPSVTLHATRITHHSSRITFQ